MPAARLSWAPAKEQETQRERAPLGGPGGAVPAGLDVVSASRVCDAMQALRVAITRCRAIADRGGADEHEDAGTVTDDALGSRLMDMLDGVAKRVRSGDALAAQWSLIARDLATAVTAAEGLLAGIARIGAVVEAATGRAPLPLAAVHECVHEPARYALAMLQRVQQHVMRLPDNQPRPDAEPGPLEVAQDGTLVDLALALRRGHDGDDLALLRNRVAAVASRNVLLCSSVSAAAERLHAMAGRLRQCAEPSEWIRELACVEHNLLAALSPGEDDDAAAAAVPPLPLPFVNGYRAGLREAHAGALRSLRAAEAECYAHISELQSRVDRLEPVLRAWHSAGMPDSGPPRSRNSVSLLIIFSSILLGLLPFLSLASILTAMLPENAHVELLHSWHEWLRLAPIPRAL